MAAVHVAVVILAAQIRELRASRVAAREHPERIDLVHRDHHNLREFGRRERFVR
jgi:hypothetical protein